MPQGAAWFTASVVGVPPSMATLTMVPSVRASNVVQYTEVASTAMTSGVSCPVASVVRLLPSRPTFITVPALSSTQ